MQNTKDYQADVVDSIKSGSDIKIDPPELKVSKDENEEKADAENLAYRMLFTQHGVEIHKRVLTLEMNLRVAYTIIFDKFCDTQIRHRIECKENFHTEIEGNPHQLLSAIKEIMHSTSSQRMVSLYDALWATMAQLFKLKQGEKMNRCQSITTR